MSDDSETELFRRVFKLADPDDGVKFSGDQVLATISTVGGTYLVTQDIVIQAVGSELTTYVWYIPAGPIDAPRYRSNRSWTGVYGCVDALNEVNYWLRRDIHLEL